MAEGIVLMPYVLIAFLTTFGIIVLIFNLNVIKGIIVLVAFVFFLAFFTLILTLTFKQLKKKEHLEAYVTRKKKYLYQNMLGMLY